MNLAKTDPQIAKLIKAEEKRQYDSLQMIPSENHTSKAVIAALGSVLTDKYSEGYPNKRYYQGHKYIDQIEILAQERAKKLFRVPHANVQPYSGSPANQAIYLACAKPGDVTMGLALPHGGHLTHGWPVNFSGILYKPAPYEVDPKTKTINLRSVEKLAKKHKPKLLWCGATAYPRTWDFAGFAKIADEVGAYFIADISHVAGLIIAGVHPNPVPYAHIIMTTTHKTLRGPRGAILMVTEKGLKKNPDLADKIDKAVFPGLQGGPHDHQTAAIAVALKEAALPQFKKYGQQVVKNAKVLSKELLRHAFDLVSGGTDNHLILIDLSNKGVGGTVAAIALEVAGIVVNKNTVPFDPMPPFYPSGIRLGTPAITTRGMGEKEMIKIAAWINQVIEGVSGEKLPEQKEKRAAFIRDFKTRVSLNKNLLKIAAEVKELSKKFPAP